MLEICLKQIKNIKSQQRKRGYQTKILELKNNCITKLASWIWYYSGDDRQQNQ